MDDVTSRRVQPEEAALGRPAWQRESAVIPVLQLEVREFTDPASWRWALSDSGGLIVEHPVRLDPSCWQFEAFTDLAGYLSRHVVPDHRCEDEARIVAGLGAWISSEVLGPVAEALAGRRPATVRVVVREAAAELLYRPLELAHVNGKPLSAQGVALVMHPAGSSGGDRIPVGGRLRVLGLFSLPDGGRPLSLRRERRSLVKLVGEISADGKAVEVRVLQYGVTRERLRVILREAEGWDIIHVSGHGHPGELLLETAAGQPDRVTAAELARLLGLARPRVKLITIAACWSAAVTAAEQRGLLGLPAQPQGNPSGQARASRVPAATGALATELSARLDCAVLAMRYPVGDDFAVALATRLYGLLLADGLELPQAVGKALGELSDAGQPALALATPTLFGGRAVGLRLAAPQDDKHGKDDSARLKLAGVTEQEPERFVGRSGVMTRAGAVLAAGSEAPGVLLHGMPGAGKTACALELAYSHADAFDYVIWYKAPDEDCAVTGPWTDFAHVMHSAVPGLRVVPLINDIRHLRQFASVLAALMRRCRLLVIIDNAESLLTIGGHWRDESWGKVIGALTTHGGPGRLILTSRRVPADATGLRTETVHALSADESLLLARELPHLHALAEGETPGIGRYAARRLLRRALEAAQGHPKLLELANGQAAHPERLAMLLDVGNQTWRQQGCLPESFFSSAEATASAAAFQRAIAAWTKAVTGTLAADERDLFRLLCCLEEADREPIAVEWIWPYLWKKLDREGEPADLGQAIAALAVCGLVAVQAGTADRPVSYKVHLAVATAAREQAGKAFHDAVVFQASGFWAFTASLASGDAGNAVDTRLQVTAGLSIVRYLLHQEQWELASGAVQSAFIRDPSRPNAAALLPTVQQIVRHDPAQAGVLAMVMEAIDPVAAEAEMRAFHDAALGRGDYWAALAANGRLAYRCRDTGRLAEALALAERGVRYARQAGLGPWTQLAEEARKLDLLAMTSPASQAVAEFRHLHRRMRALPATLGPEDQAEAVLPHDIRELVLETGRFITCELGQWNQALTLNAARIASMRERNAPAALLAEARYSDYESLLHTGRADAAQDLLLECRKAFRNVQDNAMLARTLSALAKVEDKRGRGDAAIRYQQGALRYGYRTGNALEIARYYYHLGLYYLFHANKASLSVGCHVASALIRALSGADPRLPLAAVVSHIHFDNAVPPRTLQDLYRHVHAIPGTDLPGLVTKLPPSPENASQALRDLITRAHKAAATELTA